MQDIRETLDWAFDEARHQSLRSENGYARLDFNGHYVRVQHRRVQFASTKPGATVWLNNVRVTPDYLIDFLSAE